MRAETPAVVLGAGINGLGVARSLARARVPVWLLDADARRAEMHTRCARPRPIRALHGTVLVDALADLGKSRFRGQRPVLMLTQEDSVMTVSRYRDRLAPLYRFCLPPPEVVDALLHKHGFQLLAERLGAPIPRLVRIQAEDDLPALDTLRYPVVVKPGTRNPAYSGQFRKAYRFDNAADAAALVRRILPVMADVVVQEWTEGPDANLYFCLQYINGDGTVAASFTGRKVRSWPPQVGGTASCVPAPTAHAHLTQVSTKFFRAVGAIGLAALEYKRDARSGEFRMVEPTIGRTDYQAELATLNGVNLPYAAYCDALGWSFPQPVAPVQRLGWRVRSEDLQSAQRQQQRLNAGFDNVSHVVDALWRSKDPMPWLIVNTRRVRQALRRRSAKLVPRSLASGGKP